MYYLIRDFMEKNEVNTLNKVVIVVSHATLNVIENACECAGVKNPQKFAANIVIDIDKLNK